MNEPISLLAWKVVAVSGVVTSTLLWLRPLPADAVEGPSDPSAALEMPSSPRPGVAVGGAARHATVLLMQASAELAEARTSDKRCELLMRLARRRDLDAVAVSQMVTYTEADRPMHERSCAIQALGDANHPEALPALLALLDDPSEQIAEPALRALDSSEAPEAREALLKTARERSTNLRHAALGILARRRDPEALSLIAGWLANLSDMQMHGRLVYLLGMTRDPRALPILHKYLREGSPELQMTALRALGEIGGAAAAQTLVDVVHENPGLAPAAVDALASAGGEEATQLLFEIAQGGQGYSERLMSCALQALSSRSSPEITSLMMRVLAEDNPHRVSIAVNYLAVYRVEQAIPTLVKLARDSGQSVSWSLVHALSQIGGQAGRAGLEELARSADFIARPALQILMGMTDGRNTARQIVLNKLEQTRGEQAAQWLEQLAQDDSPETRSAMFRLARGTDSVVAARALSLLGRRGDSETTDLLLAVASKPADSEQRAIAMRALMQSSDPRAVQLVRGGLKDANPEVRAQAVRTLSMQGGEGWEEAALAASKDGDPRVLEATTQALMQLGTPRAVKRLEELASSGAGANVSQQALHALYEVSPSRGAVVAQSLAASGTSEGELAAIRTLHQVSRSAGARILGSVAKSSDPNVLREALSYAGMVGLNASELQALFGHLTTNAELPEELRNVAEQVLSSSGGFVAGRLRSYRR